MTSRVLAIVLCVAVLVSYRTARSAPPPRPVSILDAPADLAEYGTHPRTCEAPLVMSLPSGARSDGYGMCCRELAEPIALVPGQQIEVAVRLAHAQAHAQIKVEDGDDHMYVHDGPASAGDHVYRMTVGRTPAGRHARKLCIAAAGHSSLNRISVRSAQVMPPSTALVDTALDAAPPSSPEPPPSTESLDAESPSSEPRSGRPSSSAGSPADLRATEPSVEPASWTPGIAIVLAIAGALFGACAVLQVLQRGARRGKTEEPTAASARVSMVKQLLAELDSMRIVQLAQYLRQLIALEAAAEGSALRERELRDSAEADAQEQELAARCTARRDKLDRAEAELHQSPTSGAIMPLLRIAAAVTCLLCEFALSYGSLPFVFSVEPATALGLAIAASPVACTVALDLVVDRLFEHPYRTRRSTPSRWRRAVVLVWYAALLAGLAVLVVFTVVEIAEVREIAMRAIQAADDAPSAGADTASLRATVIALALAVTVGAAVLLAQSTGDLRELRVRWRLRREVARLRAALAELEPAWTKAQVRAAALRRALTDLDERATIEQQRCEAELNARLAAACDLAGVSVEQLIERALRQPLERREGGWS